MKLIVSSFKATASTKLTTPQTLSAIALALSPLAASLVFPPSTAPVEATLAVRDADNTETLIYAQWLVLFLKWLAGEISNDPGPPPNGHSWPSGYGPGSKPGHNGGGNNGGGNGGKPPGGGNNNGGWPTS
jgi:hypothetical protein